MMLYLGPMASCHQDLVFVVYILICDLSNDLLFHHFGYPLRYGLESLKLGPTLPEAPPLLETQQLSPPHSMA